MRVIKSIRMRWTVHVACIGERGVAYRDWVGEKGGKEPIGRPRPRWEDNIEINLKEVGWGHIMD
jgi:hypothetical protein